MQSRRTGTPSVLFTRQAGVPLSNVPAGICLGFLAGATLILRQTPGSVFSGDASFG
jgi:hypothetical protein